MLTQVRAWEAARLVTCTTGGASLSSLKSTNGHHGTSEATGASGYTVTWQCSGACGGRKGTSIWNMKSKK